MATCLHPQRQDHLTPASLGMFQAFSEHKIVGTSPSNGLLCLWLLPCVFVLRLLSAHKKGQILPAELTGIPACILEIPPEGS